MDKINLALFSPAVQERLKQIEERKAKIREHLPEYCKVLGIDPDGNYENDLYELEIAAKIKPSCTICRWDVFTCKDCEHIGKLYDSYSGKNHFLRCETYEKYRRMEYQRAQTERLLGKSGLGKRFAGRRFETFNVTAETQEAYDACVAFCDTFSEDSKGIRLTGNYGCGKTHLTASIIHRLAEQGIGGVFVVVPELLRAIRKGYNSPNEDADKLVQLTEEAPLLVLDDLGAEKPSDWVREQLYVIINRRYENMLPTIVTTNCSTQELVDRVGQRTVSRLIEMTTPYKITAKDYRMRMA
jgi:DNA replication protein DnaC